MGKTARFSGTHQRRRAEPTASLRPMQVESLGPYRIDRELGSGGMGKVYAAVVEEHRSFASSSTRMRSSASEGTSCRSSGNGRISPQ